MNIAVQEPNAVSTWKFQNERVILIPYVENNNENQSQALPETLLATIYKKTKDQGLLQVVFPAMEGQASLNKFIAYMYGKPIVIGLTKGEVNQLAVYAWLFDSNGDEKVRRAFFGFCFFKEVWGKPEVRELSRFVLQWWFEELNIKVLYGTTLWRNKLAGRFAREMGFVSMGKAPSFFWNGKEFHDANFVYLTRERFLGTEEVSA